MNNHILVKQVPNMNEHPGEGCYALFLAEVHPGDLANEESAPPP